jgi:hypothetical protein
MANKILIVSVRSESEAFMPDYDLQKWMFECGATHDRDINATNILAGGLKRITDKKVAA